MKWIIAGLGNPGGEYAETRHNVGKMVLISLYDRFAVEDWKEHKPWKAVAAKGEIAGRDILLVAPLVFMNESGKSLLPLVKSIRQANQTIVIHDDIDMPLGTWRFAFERGSGGQKGVESIMQAIKTKAFIRVKVGVLPLGEDGKPRKPKAGPAVNKFVLGTFTEAERKIVTKISQEICEGVETLVTEGKEVAMNRWN